MAWRVDLTDEAKRGLKKLARSDQVRLARFITERLETNLDPKRLAKPLQGIRSGLWRWRVGDFRIIGRVEHSVLTILVVDIGHRRNIYRD